MLINNYYGDLVRRLLQTAGTFRLIAVLAVVATVAGCGGSSSSLPNTATDPVSSTPSTPSTPGPGPSTPGSPTPNPPAPSPQTPGVPAPGLPPQEELFVLTFPPQLSRTEAASISIVGRVGDGVEASSVSASTSDQEIALTPGANGEWRGELLLANGANEILLTVTPNAGDAQTLALASINRGVLLGFPGDLVRLGDRAFTIDRGRLTNLDLVEIDLTTTESRRVALDPNLLIPQQLLGEVNGELLVRYGENYDLLDLEANTAQPVFRSGREMLERPFVVVLDDSIDRLYATLSSQLLFADIGGALPVFYNQGVSIESPGAGSSLGMDVFNRNLLFQSFENTPQGARPLVAINVETGARVEQVVSFQGAPFTASAALPELTGLVLVDPLGQFFRLKDGVLSAISLLSSADEQATVTSIFDFDGQIVALDATRGNVFTVDPQNGSRETIFSSANGSGPRSPGWHGLLFDSTRSELLGISFIGAQSVNARNGDRSNGTVIAFEPLSAGPNFVAIPPLADGLSLDATGNNLFFAKVTNVAMGPSDFVRLNLTTGASETLATISSRAEGTLLPRFPSVVTDAIRQLAWFFDVDTERSLSRIDLETGTITDLSLSVTDRPLLAVLADSVNGRLLYATLELIEEESRLEIIALDQDGQTPETLASIVVNPDVTSVIDPRIQMALSPAGDVLYVPLPMTERVAVIDLTSGEGRVVGTSVAEQGRQFVRFSTGLSAAVAPDGRLFLVNGDGGIRAIDPGSDTQVLLSR